jgi:murein DD-endopeptidase MepM/ murein hydrolase activator NlpD
MCSQGACGCFTHFYTGTMHAIDLSCPVGTPVLAVENGTVIDVKDATTVGGIHSAHLFQWNSIMLRVDGGKDDGGESKEEGEPSEAPWYVEYVHIASGSARVKPGDVVQKGDVLCSSGDVGFCPTPHLHIQVHREMKKDSPTIPFTIKMTGDGGSGSGEVYVPVAGGQYNHTGPL